jgi:hypothetical protein
MSDEEDRTDVNFEMARSAWENLVWWLRPEKRYDVRGKLLQFDRAKAEARQRQPGLRSHIVFESANQPSGAAYSKSLYAVHLAEVARYRNSKPITEGVFGSLVTLPKSMGIMESTAQRRHDTWHRLCSRSQKKELQWEFIFIEWFREPGYCISVPPNFKRTIEEEAIVKKVHEVASFDLTDGQLAWRRLKMNEFESADGTTEKFAQEFPLSASEAFITSGLCAFSKQRLGQMEIHFVRPAKWHGYITLLAGNEKVKLSEAPDGPLSIWQMPEAGLNYYVAGDPSMGLEGGDPACAEVFWVPDDITQPLRQVAEWNGWVGPSEFARILAALGYLYNVAEVSPECNTITTVASDLVKVLNYPRWYRWMREDKIRNAYSSWIGWQTNNRNRGDLISRMRDALNEWTIVLQSEELIQEMYDFRDDGTGVRDPHFEAIKGSRDDRVMASCIAYYCATQLRPHVGELEEYKAPPGVDRQNSDFSPIWDKEGGGGAQDSDLPAYDEL